MNSEDFFLFVSHVTEDRAAASQIVDELERRGVRCWIAPRDVRPGSSFDDEIADAIESCRAMLLIFSSRCNENEYIRREITFAGNANRIIIPFRIENVEPRRGLSVRLANLHWIDAFVARERAIDDVVRSVQPSSAASLSQFLQPTKKDEARWMAPDKERWTSTFVLVALPWRPIGTPQQARALTLVGTACFAIVAVAAVLSAAAFAGKRGAEPEVAISLILAIWCAGCAVGTYLNSRVASVVGFAPIGVLTLLWLLLPLPIALAAFAGVRGTFATFRLSRHTGAEPHRRPNGA